MKAKWEIYTGSDEQIDEINEADDYITRLDKNRHTEYLICKPHPLADMICQQAQTGQPVWIKVEPGVGVYLQPSRYKTTESRGVFVTNKPDWFMPGAEYRFTPFEEEV